MEKPKEIEEESELEEDLEEAEDTLLQNPNEDDVEFDDSGFIEFLSSEKASPSLGQVAIAPELRATHLETDLSESTISNEDNKTPDEDPFKYNIGTASNETPKYFTSEHEIEKTTAPFHTTIMNLGREPDTMIPKAMDFSMSPETKIGEIEGPEKYELPGRFDIEKAGKGDTFKREEIKYRPTENH